MPRVPHTHTNSLRTYWLREPHNGPDMYRVPQPTYIPLFPTGLGSRSSETIVSQSSVWHHWQQCMLGAGRGGVCTGSHQMGGQGLSPSSPIMAGRTEWAGVGRRGEPPADGSWGRMSPKGGQWDQSQERNTGQSEIRLPRKQTSTVLADQSSGHPLHRLEWG